MSSESPRSYKCNLIQLNCEGLDKNDPNTANDMVAYPVNKSIGPLQTMDSDVYLPDRRQVIRSAERHTVW